VNTITKSADQTRTTVTLATDSELTFSTTSGKIYEASGIIIYTRGASAVALVAAFGIDTTYRGQVYWNGINSNDTGIVFAANGFQTNGNQTFNASSAGDRVFSFYATFVGNGSAALFQWAGNNTNSLTVKAGSQLRYNQIT